MSKSLEVTASLNVSGPLLSGQAQEALDQFSQDVEKAIAEEAVRMLSAVPMDRSGRSAGAFREHLHPTRRSAGTAVFGPMIKGVTWAPWLEGVTERNRSTGFPGYKLFANTRLELDRGRAQEIAERELEKFLPQME